MWMKPSILKPVTAASLSQSLQTATPTKRSAPLSRTRRLERAAPKTSCSTTVKRWVESTLKASAWSRPTTTPTRSGPLAVTWWLSTTRLQVKFTLTHYDHQSNSLVWPCSPGGILHMFPFISPLFPAGGGEDSRANRAEKSGGHRDSDTKASPGGHSYQGYFMNSVVGITT